MANLSIAALLLALVLASLFVRPEPFSESTDQDSRTSSRKCQVDQSDCLSGMRYAKLSQDGQTCSVEIQETDDTKELDVTCGPTSKVLGTEGIYQRSGYSLLDNGRFRRSEGSDHVCTLLMSDDLVQTENGPKCGGNPNLKDESKHTFIGALQQNGAYCEIPFIEDATDKQVKDYLDFLSTNASRVVTSMGRRN